MGARVVGLAVILSCGLLFTGCANQEQVKKDEEAIPQATSSGNGSGKQQGAGQQSGVQEKNLAQAQVKEETPAAGTSSAANAVAEAPLETVYFAFDSYVLSPEARESLAKNAAALKKGNTKVQIEGHCDERGSDEYNLALGEKRAKAARDYLTALGVPADRLSIISYGKEKPADPGHDEAAWAKNRRAVLLVQK